jgi:large subunit ribosomal protein L24
MKTKFNKNWIKSKQPRKKRKYIANAPLHIKRKFLSSNLSKELRKKQNKKNIPVKKGDTIKIMRGKFKNKKGKIQKVFTKLSRITIEGIQVKKQDGSKTSVKIRPCNVQIIELNTDDTKRFNNRNKEIKSKKIKKDNNETKQKNKKQGDKK